ncbi:tryptophan synthase [Aspergillus affinis]|uniref:tryptophan synthase n=1 Tax=Aspergillus affinis TaxID=1070780 RepID=UPI0022FE5703|nr:tryptophan synthase beta subunit-like PLP-dependent enzyme [Aspergillus affinis]KAI9040546.1 tryptophan synthase beta subunit-like PLP-dependent enzyme [Aspergillus affinis]
MLIAPLPPSNILPKDQRETTETTPPAQSWPTPESIKQIFIQRISESARKAYLAAPPPPAPAPDLSRTHFGEFGGQFALELQVEPLHDLAAAFQSIITDESFCQEYLAYTAFCPTPLHLAKNLTHRAGGATIWLKREDRNPYRGSHCVRSMIGQILFAKRLGMREIVTDCGSACHGVACASLCAALGLQCTVFIGVDDAARQCAGVQEMQRLGANIVPAETASGCRTLKAAVNSALAHSLTDQSSIYYVMGGPIGAHPLPVINRTFQKLLGEEVKIQLARLMGREGDSASPDALISPLEMGGAATGLFYAFVEEDEVRLVCVEAEGAAPLAHGSVGVLHGCRTLVLQDENGQIQPSEAIAPDMNFPSVGPEVAHWKSIGRVEGKTASDEEAMEGLRILAEEEQVTAGLNTGYAVGETMRLAKELGPGQNVVLLVTGKDDIH